MLLTDAGELETYEEAISCERKNEWHEAMQEELKSLHENHTFELVKLSQGKRTLTNKWVYKLKTEENSLQG